MNPKKLKIAPLGKLKALRARIDAKLKQLKEMRKLKEMTAETRTRLNQGIKELEKTRKVISHSIEKLIKRLKR